jgi:hypothetical protein
MDAAVDKSMHAHTLDISTRTYILTCTQIQSHAVINTFMHNTYIHACMHTQASANPTARPVSAAENLKSIKGAKSTRRLWVVRDAPL